MHKLKNRAQIRRQRQTVGEWARAYTIVVKPTLLRLALVWRTKALSLVRLQLTYLASTHKII